MPVVHQMTLSQMDPALQRSSETFWSLEVIRGKRLIGEDDGD